MMHFDPVISYKWGKKLFKGQNLSLFPIWWNSRNSMEKRIPYFLCIFSKTGYIEILHNFYYSKMIKFDKNHDFIIGWPPKSEDRVKFLRKIVFHENRRFFSKFGIFLKNGIWSTLETDSFRLKSFYVAI